MKKLLTLTDFSDIADQAIKAAIVLAKKYGAELMILHVQTSTKGKVKEVNIDSLQTEGFTTSEIKNIEEWVAVADKNKVPVTVYVGHENINDSVNTILNSSPDTVLIMGSTGIDHSDNAWGTTTQLVVKNVDVPVLVIKNEMTDFRMDNIVFASDLDKEDQQVLNNAITLIQPEEDATIHLLSINTSSFFTQPGVVMMKALQEFEEIVHPLEANSKFYRDYSVDAGIRHFVEEVHPDILIMSNRGRHILKDIFIPNAAMKAVGSFDCPVLILK